MSAWRKIPATAWHLLLVTLLGLPLLAPLLMWTAVPCTHDGHLHYHRVAAMRHAWENGVAFSRWLPDLAFGYGYPFFVYREPAPLYAVLLPHLLGLPLPAAENLFYILCLLAGGWFMFLWVRDLFGVRAGLVSAVAYMSAPYVLVDALVRGNAPESLALPLLPFLLWAGRRWLLSGRRRWFVVSVLGLAFFALSHNISLLLFTPALLLYLLALAFIHRLEWRTAVARTGLLLLLGLGMTAWYAGGALLEMEAVTLQLSTTTRNNDFRYNFASLAEILAPVSPEDPALLNPPLLFRLGWAPLGLALLGLVSLPWQQGRERRWHIGLMGLATAVFLLMALPVSRFVWEAVPLIEFVQFPWRFVGRAALPLALLAGAPFAGPLPGRLLPARLLRLFFFLALSLLLLEAMPNLYPNRCPEAPFPTILTVFQYERGTGLVGVDPEGSYFPRTVQRRPQDSPLEADYAAGIIPRRLDTASLPAGATLDTAVYHPLAATLHLTSPEPFVAVFHAFAFPGWQVTVDGQPVPITASEPEGVITFPVPAGRHTAVVAWASTPLRTALTAVSLLALLGLVALVIGGRRPLFAPRSLPLPANCLSRTDAALLAGLALALLGAKLAVDRIDTPLRRPAAPSLMETAVLQGGELRLDGFNLDKTLVESGGTFDVDMAWTAVDFPQAAYQTNVWLAGPDGLAWSDKETFRPRLYEDAPPAQSWQPGQWAWDSREVQVLPGTPPGLYDIVLTLFDRETLQPVTLLDEAGEVVGPTAVIGRMKVIRPQTPPVFTPQVGLNTPLPQAGATLLGYNQDRGAAAPGDPLLLTLFWQQTALSSVRELSLELQDETGAATFAWMLLRPDSLPGERVRSQHLLRLPPHLADGRYRFVLQASLPLGTVMVTAPERTFDAPPVATAVNAPFTLDGEPLATLAGYTLEPAACPPEDNHPAACAVELVWRAEAPFPASYRVFVHLVDDTGQILAQADGEPVSWRRPTTGWAPGEYLADTHTLPLPEPLPAAQFNLRIGLYHPETGQRLQTGAADYLEIPLGERP